jgi:hypothetical protein
MTLVPELRLEVQRAAERLTSRGANHRPTWRRMRRRRASLASGGIAVCGVIIVAVAVLLVSATSSPSPAYALTPHADGSYTLRIHTLSGDIPQLNAKLRALGIDITVVPIVQGCPNVVPSYPVNGQLTITLRPNHYDLVPGEQGFLAARVLADGRLQYMQGAMAANEIPSCFGTQQVQIIPDPGPTTTPIPSPTTSSSYSLTGGDRQPRA